jgi:DNA polymerase (family 10)
MTNKDIAQKFDLLAQVMQLLGENSFKIRSYQNAARYLKKVEQPLSQLSRPELEALPGVGKAIADKIGQLLLENRMSTLDGYLEKVPAGVVELLTVPGLGVQKVQVIWQEMGIESPGELLYACTENRLTDYKGFGAKTQAQLLERLEFHFAHQGKMRLPAARHLAAELSNSWQLPIVLLGEAARYNPVVNHLVVGVDADVPQTLPEGLTWLQHSPHLAEAQTDGGFQITCHRLDAHRRGTQIVELTGPRAFIAALGSLPDCANEDALWPMLGRTPIPAPMRDNPMPIAVPPQLIADHHIKHVIHTHTKWSDGLHTVAEMAEAAQKAGFASITITDHSRSAGYAGGLSIERVLLQWAEIDGYNAAHPDFRVLRGIESDILIDGRLDYPNEILAGFDLVVASVHSGLRMDADTATARLLHAIRHPHTHVLGHPTGRLLLSRSGYNLHFAEIFEACAAHKVAIELNANPARLDLDWSLVARAVAAGVVIAINPDAHSREAISHIRYGVESAQKAGLEPQNCLNTWPLEQLLAFLS